MEDITLSSEGGESGEASMPARRSATERATMTPEESKGKSGVAKFFDGMVTNTGVAGEVLYFLWQRKLWWLIPMVTVLLLFGLLLIFATSSGVAPFIYTLF
jgi:hypothetical protein